MAVVGVGFLPPFVCVSVFPHSIIKTNAARITELDIGLFHDESWKPIYFGVKRSRLRVTKTLLAWPFSSSSRHHIEPLNCLYCCSEWSRFDERWILRCPGEIFWDRSALMTCWHVDCAHSTFVNLVSCHAATRSASTASSVTTPPSASAPPTPPAAGPRRSTDAVTAACCRVPPLPSASMWPWSPTTAWPASPSTRRSPTWRSTSSTRWRTTFRGGSDDNRRRLSAPPSQTRRRFVQTRPT